MTRRAMHRVLVVSYTFPPTGGAGVQRVSKFVKYMRRFGWEPVVLTTANPSVPLRDESLLADLPEDIQVHYAQTLEPSYEVKQNLAGGTGQGATKGLKTTIKNLLKSLLLPDPQVLWWPRLIPKLREIIKNSDIDLVFVTSPPYSALVPSVFVARQLGVPVVADFRDEWTFSREQWENASKHFLSRKLDAFLESYVVSNCTRYTATTESYIQSISGRYPKTQKSKGIAITNGYDEEDLYGDERLEHRPDTVSIVYTGTVWNATSLHPFMAAADEVVANDPSLAASLQITIIGRVVGSEMAAFKGAAAKCSSLLGYVDHDRAVAEMKKADILLLSLSDLPGAERIFPGKVFEYMATGRHIFAVVPEGETYNLLQKDYGNCTVVSPSSVSDIADKLRAAIDNIDGVRKAGCKDISHFSRARLTQTLCSIFEDCISPAVNEEGVKPTLISVSS